MRIKDLKNCLKNLKEINFKLENGNKVPPHFHVTEIGLIKKNFIDCGGSKRTEEKINFQLWTAEGHDHRLSSTKLLKIIELAENELQLPNAEIEVEYQGETIGKYGLDFKESTFLLTLLQTDCLAKDNCGIPTEKPKLQLSQIGKSKTVCTPGGGCC